MARISKRTWTGIGAGVAALVLGAGVVGAVNVLSDDGDSGDDTVVVAQAKQGDGEIETTTSTEHDVDHGTHDDDTDGNGHEDGHGDDDDTGGTHDDGHGDDDDDTGGTHNDGHGDDGGGNGGGGGNGHGDGHGGNGGNGGGGGGGGTKPDPCKDTGHQGHNAGRAKCPRPDPDPDPCDDTHQQHRAPSAGGTDDCEPDPCEGHEHNTNPDDPCNPEPCDDTHQQHGAHGAPTAGEGCPDDVVQYEDLSPEVQALVDQGTALALQYPTAAEAQAAGWGKITIYFPGIAQHNLKSPILDSTFDPANPEVLLYGRDGQLVGINYIVRSIGGPPEGFPGADDIWHEHPSLCLSLTTGLVIGGENLSVEECAAIGGFVIGFQNFWLLHVWTIPGYESPEGVFSHENSRV